MTGQSLVERQENSNNQVDSNRPVARVRVVVETLRPTESRCIREELERRNMHEFLYSPTTLLAGLLSNISNAPKLIFVTGESKAGVVTLCREALASCSDRRTARNLRGVARTVRCL